MGEKEELFRQFNQGNGNWQQFIKSIKIVNIHGWQGQEISFNYPVVAIVGENGIGKSTFLKAAVCAYHNKGKKDFYPSKMFMRTQWDEEALNGKKGACHREQFVNKSSFGLTGIVLRHIIRKIVFIGKAVYYDDQRPYIYQDQRT